MTEHQNETNNEISLVDLYHIIRKNIIIILFFTALFFAAATFYAFNIVTPKYKSNADVMIQVQTNPDTETYDYLTAQRLIATITELFKKEVIVLEAMQNIASDVSLGEIRNGLSVTSSQTSFFISISYLSEDPVLARIVVNEIIDAAIEVVNTNPSFTSLANKITRTSFAQDGRYDSPNKLLYMVIGTMLGGILGVGIVFTKEFFKNTYQTKEQLENDFGIQVLGVIPKFENKEGRK